MSGSLGQSVTFSYFGTKNFAKGRIYLCARLINSCFTPLASVHYWSTLHRFEARIRSTRVDSKWATEVSNFPDAGWLTALEFQFHRNRWPE